jgi:hypothetical protein
MIIVSISQRAAYDDMNGSCEAQGGWWLCRAVAASMLSSQWLITPHLCSLALVLILPCLHFGGASAEAFTSRSSYVPPLN